MSNTKYIFITGGVVSSIGKGIATASLGRLLRNRGFNVVPIKLDPYINVDAGTMNPYQHGEVFVTEDGAETDLDLGHYERFMDVNCSNKSSITAGKIYKKVIKKERNGEYLGGTVQVIPHITNEIKASILELTNSSSTHDPDIVIAEIGGTIGDIESLPFMEAIRQFKHDVGHENCMYIHVSFIPQIGPWCEIKTKPTQHSVIKLREIGISPDVLICRTEKSLSHEINNKLSLFCDVPTEAVIESKTVKTVYGIPITYERLGLGELITKRLNLPSKAPKNQNWIEIVEAIENPTQQIEIAAIGKYTENGDAYKSIVESCIHAGIPYKTKVRIQWIDSEKIDEMKNIPEFLSSYHALIVGPGFGKRGIEGKLSAIQHARINKLPFLGICLGMQCAVIEYAKNVCGISGATSEEIHPESSDKLIHYLPGQESLSHKGGSMRLGSYQTVIKPGTLAEKLYQSNIITDRHRHRYEVNHEYMEILSKNNLEISGTSPNGKLVEIIELKNHPYFIATQAHPEFKSRPNRPSPLFLGLVEAALKYKSVPVATI